MRIYVGGKYQEKEDVRIVQLQIKGLGHIITHDWTAEKPNMPREVYAVDDILGVQTADHIVMVVPKELAYKGIFVEMGAALALSKPVHIIGHGVDTCVFVHHPLVVKHENLDEYISSIGGQK